MNTEAEYTMHSLEKAPELEGRVFDEDGIYVQASLIPWDYKKGHLVYFVSGYDGDEYGQFADEKTAIEKAKFMVTVPKIERRRYDQ